MREEIVRKIEKWQEPPPAKTIKPLPAPDAEQKKRRGGKRLRKMKERYGLTDVRKAANRMNFNVAEEEYMAGDEVRRLGQGMQPCRSLVAVHWSCGACPFGAGVFSYLL